MIKIKKKYIDTLYLALALLIYAFFSSSTPENIGVFEIAIGFFLILFVGMRSILDIFQNIASGNSIIPGYVYFTFLVLLILPFYIGIAISENSIYDIVRDVIPFIYLFIPIFFISKMKKDPKYWSNVLLILISIIGVSFSYRHLFTTNNPFSMIGKEIIFGNKEYFPMDPAVLFTSSILILLSAKELFIKHKMLKSSILMVLGFFTYLSIVSILVRAQIILVLFVLIVYVLYISKVSIFRLLFILGTFGAIVFFNLDIINDSLTLMLNKFESAGLSNRDTEFIAVLENASHSMSNAIFGEGWGGLIQNPASPGSKIRFTHNIFNYFILKGGIIGLILIISYFIFIAKMLFRNRFTNDSVLRKLVLFNIIIVHLILEPGFKMMSIGLILTYFILYFQKDRE